MKRQSLIYVVMLMVAALGLWAVMRVGARLEAAADLGGDWTFDSGPLGPKADGPEGLGKGFHIDQSGRFLRIRFDNGRQLDLRAEKLPLGKIGGSPVPVELSDGNWQLGGTLRQENGMLIGAFTMKGPERARFVAYRKPIEDEKAPAVAPNPPTPAPSAGLTPIGSPAAAPAVALAPGNGRAVPPEAPASPGDTAQIPVVETSTVGTVKP